MGTPSADVEQYLTDLQHPLKEGVLQIRAAILASDSGSSPPTRRRSSRWSTLGAGLMAGDGAGKPRQTPTPYMISLTRITRIIPN
jgi:hypothetical protein